ncbi:hypothetical protein [uncultured Rikenella sp.]|nr:hypothetical protein [uncultured Rikenella sp.]
MHLNFDMTNLNPGNEAYRSYGLPLRCLSHPQGVLLAASALLLS